MYRPQFRYYILLLTLLVSVPVSGKHGFSERGNPANQQIWLNVPETMEAAKRDYNDSDSVLIYLGLKEITAPYSLSLQADVKRPSGRVLTYRQYYRNLVVIGAGVKICLNKQDELISWSVNLLDTETQPKPDFRVKKSVAISLAQAAIKSSKYRSNPLGEKVILPWNGIAEVCWRIELPAFEPLGDWEVFISCDDGEVLLVEDRALRFDGVGSVFDPDPKTALNDSSLTDDDDRAEAVPDGAYTQVNLLEISLDEEDQYILSGQWVSTEPTEDRARMEEPEFLFDRENDHFEEVMAYYHIDRQARYLVTLGFGESLPDPLLVNINGIAEDISFFSPQTGILTTGTGGVDDAEDADVLLHEYGHAVIYETLGDWRGGETGVLGEGLCDYLAGEYSLTLDDDFQPFYVYNWDGHNQFWEGRVLNSTLKYSEIEGLDRYEAGQLWSSLLTEVLLQSQDRDSWNQIVIDHISALADSSTLPLAAEALLQSERELAEGAFRHLIVQACENREVFPPGIHSPLVHHERLNDMEDIEADRRVEVAIRSVYPLDADRIWLIYASEEDDPDTLSLEIDEDLEDVYFSTIHAPGVETDIEYYFVATDSSGVFTIDPRGAPLIGYRYYIGTDRTPPTIHRVDTLRTTVFNEGELRYSASVTDNLGIDQVGVRWFNSQMEEGGSSVLDPVLDQPTQYTGTFQWLMGDGRVIFYQTYAMDSSEAGNISYSRLQPFELVNDAMIEDFDIENHRWIFEHWERVQYVGRDSSWAVASRVDELAELPLSSTLTLDENWNLSKFNRFRLYFWERHNFDNEYGENGTVEISLDSGESWEEVLQLRGVQRWRRRYNIDLAPYAGDGNNIFNIRWKAFIAENENPENGWDIDEIFASTRTIVSTAEAYVSSPLSFSISAPFPNPTNGLISFNYQLPASGTISLIDMNGRVVTTRGVSVGKARLFLRTDKLSSGLYFILANTPSKAVQMPIIILK